MHAAGADNLDKNSGEARALSEAFRGRSVYIETYGCRYNFGDTAKLVEILSHLGCTITETAEAAEIVIINTCTVVGSTERRMLRRLSLFRNKNLYVTGCMPLVQREAILAVCSPRVINPDIIHELYHPADTVSSGRIGIVQLAQGCAGKCTYCLTRFARGPLRSFPKREILSQIQRFARAGTPEIHLTAQDVSAWGTDIGQSLPELLKAIDRIPGPHRIRIGMMNPATVKWQVDDLVDAFAGDHLYKFVHLPVQSGSDACLSRMGRGYTVAEFEEIIRSFRRHYEKITLATDVIVGFCGETDADFSAAVDLIRRIRPAKVNVTRYSRRPFTPLASENDYPESVKKERSRILERVAGEIYSSVNVRRLGEVVPFLVTEILRKGSVLARSSDYTGVVIREDLPIGFRGNAILREDRKFFFIGKYIR